MRNIVGIIQEDITVYFTEEKIFYKIWTLMLNGFIQGNVNLTKQGILFYFNCVNTFDYLSIQTFLGVSDFKKILNLIKCVNENLIMDTLSLIEALLKKEKSFIRFNINGCGTSLLPSYLSYIEAFKVNNGKEILLKIRDVYSNEIINNVIDFILNELIDY